MHEETQRKLRVAGCVRMTRNRGSRKRNLQPATLQLALLLLHRPHVRWPLSLYSDKKAKADKILKKNIPKLLTTRF